MTPRRALPLVALLVAPVLALLPAAPAEALVMPPAGWVHEVDSEFGDARIAGTADGLLVSRPGFGLVERWRFGQEPEVIATGIDGIELVAWDPTTDDAVVSSLDGSIRRVHDGTVTTIATDLIAIRGLDVGADGAVYAGYNESEIVEPTPYDVVGRFAPDGSRSIVASGLDYITTIAVEPDGDVLVAESTQLLRFRDGNRTTVAGAREYCAPPDPCGDEGQAPAARFAEITSMDVGADGSIYLTEHRNARVRVIRPDGVVHNLLGSHVHCVKVERDDCIPGSGPRSPIQKVLSIGLSGGDLFAVDQDDARRWTRLLQVTDVDRAPPFPNQGYRMIASDGGVFTFGWSPFHGSTGDLRLVSPIVAGRSNGAGGYWFVAGDGGVFTFGDAPFFGSASGMTDDPVVDMAVRWDGDGYAVLERSGVFFFNRTLNVEQPDWGSPNAALVITGPEQARVVGEQPSSLPRLNVPIVAAHSTRSGKGIWYVASDGGVFTDGDAGFFGSTGAMRLNQPVLDLIPTPSEQGYWLIAADGGVFTFGDAEFFGSMGGVRLNRPVVAGVAGPTVTG